MWNLVKWPWPLTFDLDRNVAKDCIWKCLERKHIFWLKCTKKWFLRCHHGSIESHFLKIHNFEISLQGPHTWHLYLYTVCIAHKFYFWNVLYKYGTYSIYYHKHKNWNHFWDFCLWKCAIWLCKNCWDPPGMAAPIVTNCDVGDFN